MAARNEQVAAFYQRHARMIKRVVERQVHDGPTADDACSLAWTKLLTRPDIDLDHRGVKWLCTVAIREGWRDAQTASGLERLDAPAVENETVGDRIVSGATDTQARVEAIERLALLDELSEDRRNAVLLQAAGLTYAEISAATGATSRKTQRDLARGHAALRALDNTELTVTPRDPVALLHAARERHVGLVLERANSPAESHAELDRKLGNVTAAVRGLCAEVVEQHVTSPPPWATDLFGDRPVQPAKSAVYDQGVREAARYRVAYGVRPSESRLGVAPMRQNARAAFQHADTAVQATRRALGQRPTAIANVGQGRAAAAVRPAQLSLNPLPSHDAGRGR